MEVCFTLHQLAEGSILDKYMSRELVPTSCAYCGKLKLLTKHYIQTKIAHGSKNFYCSNKCCGIVKTATETKKCICANCGKSIIRRLSQMKSPKGNVFCSQACAARTNNLGKQKNPPKERTCKICNITFFRTSSHRPTKFCKTCWPKYQEESGRKYYEELTIGDYRNRESVSGKHPSWVHAHIRSFARSWHAELTKLPCEVCGYDKHIELCHVRPISSFPDSALLKEVNSRENIRVLCPNHHWELDNQPKDSTSDSVTAPFDIEYMI